MLEYRHECAPKHHLIPAAEDAAAEVLKLLSKALIWVDLAYGKLRTRPPRRTGVAGLRSG